MVKRYDEKGRQIIRLSWSQITNLPNLVFQLSEVEDPDADGVLAWDDSEHEFVLQPIQGANQQVFHGYVDSVGVAEDLPSGWSLSTPSTGNYIITHGLGLSSTTDLRVVVTPIEGENTGVRPSITDLATNSFDVHIDDDAGDADMAFFFIAILKDTG